MVHYREALLLFMVTMITPLALRKSKLDRWWRRRSHDEFSAGLAQGQTLGQQSLSELGSSLCATVVPTAGEDDARDDCNGLEQEGKDSKESPHDQEVI